MKKAFYTILTFPIVKNDTEEHRAMNRRTDVSFKIIEQ